MANVDVLSEKTTIKNANPLTPKQAPGATPLNPIARAEITPAQISTIASGAAAVLKPSPPNPNTDNGELQITGLVWYVGLTNDQTHALESVLGAGGEALAPLGGPLWPAIAAALASAVTYIEIVNKLGGSNGVDINGVVGVEGVIVTPRVGEFYGELIQAARLAVTGRTIVDFLIIAAGQVPALGATLGIPVVASVLTLVEAGNPLGWALAGALGFAINLLESAPDPNAHGHIWVNRAVAADWESFIMGQVAPGNKVSLLSPQGLFSAQGGGGNDVYANRPQVGDWETWTLIDNNDGTVSFQSFNGNYLSALQGGGTGDALYVNRTKIGSWEKFYLENVPGGKIALKAHDSGQYVSVQP